MTAVSEYSGMMDMASLLWLRVRCRGFLDDGVADDAGGDGEYWEEYGKSPLLRFCFARDFPGHTAICKTRAKRKNAIFRQKSQGGELGLYALMDTYTKSYTEIHFYMQCKIQKAPLKRSLKFVSKNANGFVIYRGMLSALRQAQGPCLYASVHGFMR